MAPNRRKSKASAAAAVAARRQWKVGDLVLAKIKGFPAWPAVVSDPEKWGYSADWKKVLVFFFGTNQIAFCNPADVESFTEEKKESLRGKRHGKGADFVRAVKEIIDKYESNIMKETGNLNAVDDVSAANEGNIGDSLANSRLRNQTESSPGTFISQLNSDDPRDKDEVSCPAEDAMSNDLHDRDTLPEEPTDNIVAETSLTTTYSSRKRSGSALPNSQLKKRRDLRSRGSSRSHNLVVVSSNDVSENVRDISSNELQDGSVGRNKQISRSPDASDTRVAASPAVISNGSIQDDGSEIITLDSDCLSLNEVNTFEFGNNLEHGEGVVELGNKLDFQIKAVVIKKKRKPNRKRVGSDACKHTPVLDKVSDGDVEMHKTDQKLPSVYQKLDGNFSKEDGDEHLPLVKRARVRMGKGSTMVKLDSSMMEENSKMGVSFNLPVLPSSDCAQNGPANKNTPMVKDNAVKSSLLNTCFQFQESCTQGLENRKSQAFGTFDGEAALPPSKRLHRALEAMSANVAEDGLACAQTPLTNGCVASPIRKSQESKERKSENNLEEQYVDCNGQYPFKIDVMQMSAEVNPLILQEIKSSSADAVDIGSAEISKENFEIAQSVIQASSTNKVSPDLDERSSAFRISQDSLDQLSPKKEEKCEIMMSSPNKAEIQIKEADATKSNAISEVEAAVITKDAPQNVTTVHLYNKEGSCCDNTQSWKIPPDGDSQVDGMCEIVRETNNKSPERREKVSTPIWGANNSYDSASVSDDTASVKDVSGIHSSPSPADKVSSPAQDFPSYNPLFHLNKTGANSIVQNNGCGSPEVKLPNPSKKTVCTLHVEEKIDSAVTSVGKSHADAGAYLTSFETLLGGLTRTKESIGRATRIALDCAKYGAATKVLNILARHMENEPSLSKRVDFFFLVDSITQCSRGLKGDVHDTFTSAIQSMLPRLLSAAAPPGNSARENRRQCLKVLRLWLERKTFPETIVQQHMHHLDSLNWSSCPGAASRRPLRNERAFDDPLREMEGMLVDEYGSNSTLQLQGFCMPHMLKVENDESDSDGGSFEAVTPEHNSETPEKQEPTITIGKYKHILEDVDGELEMEDVAPSCEIDTSNANEVGTAQTPKQKQYAPSSLAPLPINVPSSSPPPLPTSPPPLPPPPPPPLPPPPSAVHGTYVNDVDAKLYVAANNLQDSFQAVAKQEPLNYHVPERQNYQMETRLPDSTATCSYGNFNVSRVPVGPMNNVPQTDGEVLHNKPYHLPPPPPPPPPPPLPPPSNNYSYAHADPRANSWRDVPFPHYSNRHHFPPNMDGGNYYTDHDRSIPHEYHERSISHEYHGRSIPHEYRERSNPHEYHERSYPHEYHERSNPHEYHERSNPHEYHERSNPHEYHERSNPHEYHERSNPHEYHERSNPHEYHERSNPHELNDRWRFSGPSLSDPYYHHDRSRAPDPYMQSEPYRTRNQGWSHHSPEINYRRSMPIRQPCEDPRYWRPG